MTGGPAGPEAPPTCYRHPDRETWVRCTRCERPICPEDMREAAVGFQCPECVAAGNRSVRPARTAYGGRLSADAGRATVGIIALDVLVYLLQRSDPSVTDRFAMFGFGIADGQVYRLLTAAFLHGSLLHLGVNMYALYLFGPQLEAVLGRTRYLTLFVLSALGGSTVSYLVNDPRTLGVGASGAVFGLLGALAVASRRRGLDTGPLLAMIGINLVISFLVPVIDLWAHLGGLATGAVLAGAWAYPAGRGAGAGRQPAARRRDLAHLAVAVAVAATLLLAVSLRSAALLG